MIHEVQFDQGTVTYINRFVETEGHKAEQEVGRVFRWFDVASCYCYHTVNAFENDDEVKPAAGDRRDLPMLHQWRFNLKTGEVTERALDTEWGSEFARINENLMGVRNQYTYAARIAGDTLESGFDGIVKYDLANDTSVHYPYGPGR